MVTTYYKYKNIICAIPFNLLYYLNMIKTFSSNEDIIKTIIAGDHDEFGAEKLKGLKKILPEDDEVQMLKDYARENPKIINDDQTSKLGNPEIFLLKLVDVPK